MKRYLNILARRCAGAVWGASELNGFVYNACLRNGVRRPDIPVRSVEFYGQCGEDLVVISLLTAKALSEGVDLSKQKYLEIGGNHPFATSATFLLNKRLNMTGVIVEANPKLIEELKKGRPNDIVVHGAVQDRDVNSVQLSISKLSELSSLDRTFVLGWANGSIGEAELVAVPALRLNQIVHDYLHDDAPYFLSIDVEGLDLMLLRDFDFRRYRPWFVQTEPSDHHIPGNTKNIVDYMRSANYDLIAMTAVNLIFGDRNK